MEKGRKFILSYNRIVLLAILGGLLFTSCGVSAPVRVVSQLPTLPPTAIKAVEATKVAATVTATVTRTSLPSPIPTSTATPTVVASTTATLEVIPTATNPPVQTLGLHSCVANSPLLQRGVVTGIADGDTIEVQIDGNSYKVRYIGIDTPETYDPNNPPQYYSQEATDRNTALVAGKEIILVKDVSETDRYDRLLRYVFVDGLFVNLELVQGGFAYAKAYPPDTACHDVFTTAQQSAQAAGIGLWMVTGDTRLAATLPPATTSGCPQGCTESQPGCEIKGNINSEGVKIYHVPGGKYYAKTIITPSDGERWFCTVDEAVANGWRAPLN